MEYNPNLFGAGNNTNSSLREQTKQILIKKFHVSYNVRSRQLAGLFLVCLRGNCSYSDCSELTLPDAAENFIWVYHTEQSLTNPISLALESA